MATTKQPGFRVSKVTKSLISLSVELNAVYAEIQKQVREIHDKASKFEAAKKKMFKK